MSPQIQPIGFFLSFVLAILALNLHWHCVEAISEDGSSLLALKKNLVDEFGHLDDWKEADSSPCSWTGISCDEYGKVVSLDLGNMNLTGIITSDIGRLKSLINISLELNNFTGFLPSELSQCIQLRYLNISHNNFSHRFPANFSKLRFLEVLDGYNNNFSGPLPAELGELKNLRHFHLGGSYIEGPIPVEYGSMKRLTYMALSGNLLTGRIPAELGNLTELQYLYLGYFNVFDDGIPKELGKLKNLILIDLAYCGLTGSIPEEIGNLINLDSIFFQINHLSGPIPAALGKLTNLKSLDLSNNELVGSIPQEFGMLGSLQLMNLFRNNLTGFIPAEISDLPNLQVLQLWGNKLSGEIPHFLGKNGNLTILDLSSNSLNGSIPPFFCTGGNLQVLILYGNQLTGPIPDNLGICQSLVRVRLGTNKLTGGVPKGLLSLRSIRMLELISNNLNGSIEGDFNALNLEFLDFSKNQIHGTLPDQIGNLTSLQNLCISNNRLAGPIPSGIQNLQKLSALDLSGNVLSGKIPPEIGKCERLATMDLSRNQLTGEIPPELSNLQVLDVLNLSRNFLSGKIPSELELLVSLTTADFSYNRLSGPIPQHGQFAVFNSSSFVGNPALCGFGLQNCSAEDAMAPSAMKNKLRRESSLLAWLVGAIFSAAVLVLVIGICCFFKKYHQYIYGLFNKDKSVRPWKFTAFQRLDFNATHILECLNEDNIIGRGGSGIVYKGIVPSGETVAVKRLSQGKKGATHDHGFSAEIQTLGKIRHRNIVKLLGFCSNHETNLLVYEYMPNGSLGELLHGKKGAVLDWATRYKIAVQSANGLCYLHHDCSPLIVHRDVKSNNILLDSDFQAHVADFGLAKLFQGSGKSESMSSIAGSYGYIAPEYAYTLKVNEKSDIYSFGVVLLELVTGRRPIEPAYGDGVDIVQWVRRKIQTKDGVLDILDQRMATAQLPLHETMLVLRVALLCSNDLPVDRPTMRDVVQMLQDVKPRNKDSKEFGNVQPEELMDV